MAPRILQSAYPTQLTTLISSTSYPPIPPLDDLLSLKAVLEAQQASISARISNFNSRPSSIAAGSTTGSTTGVGPPGDDERRQKKKNQKREREEAEERERAALEANEKSGMRLEVIERKKKEMSMTSDVKRERKSASPAPSNASSASFRPQHNLVTYGAHNKKKKHKRLIDSEDETPSVSTPPPHSVSTTSGLKLKLAASAGNHKSRPSLPDPSPTPSASTITTGPGAGIDFSLPNQPQRPLVPPRPGVQKAVKPGPKKQSEVDEDYSDKKAPSQINYQTFWQTVEPYIRDIREDDLAMLNFKADAPELFEIPPRGRHYTEVWDEEDNNPPGTTPRVSVPNMRPPPSVPVEVGPASELREEQLVEEYQGLGPLTERVVAAVVKDTDNSIAVGVPEPEAEGSREHARTNATELEERMKKELRSSMLLGEHEEFDPNARDDDEITSALRQCQRLLLQQITINDARKSRLAEIAKHRLAYHEYHNMLDGLEKSIENGWAKRIKKHGSSGRKVLKNGEITGNGRPAVPEGLKKSVQTRAAWIEKVGTVFKGRKVGEVIGIPNESIYEGIMDEAEERDEKTIDEAMDLDDVDADEVDGMAV